MQTSINPNSYTILAIQNYGSSGSLFLQSLLDNHPQVLSIPGLYMKEFYQFWEKLPDKKMKKQQMVELFIQAHQYWFYPQLAQQAHGFHQMGETMEEQLFIPAKKFAVMLLNYLITLKEVNRHHFFVAVYLAYAHALNRDLSTATVIIFPFHTLEPRYSQQLVLDFPDIKILHTIREPTINFGSCIKHFQQGNNSGAATEVTIAQIFCDYIQQWYPSDFQSCGANFQSKQVSKNSFAIKLESLHDDLHSSTTEVCQWLDIEWNEVLLESTFDGKKWWNRPGTIRDSGKSKNIRQQNYAIYLNRFDRWRIKNLAHQEYLLWQYSITNFEKSKLLSVFMPILLLVPFKSEFVTLSKRIVFTQKWLEIIARNTHRLLIELNTPLIERFFILKNEELSTVKIKKILTFFIQPLLLLITLSRDYWVTRVWAIKSWKLSLSSKNNLVPLLSDHLKTQPEKHEQNGTN